MQSKEAVVEDGEIKSVTAVGSEIDGWTNTKTRKRNKDLQEHDQVYCLY